MTEPSCRRMIAAQYRVGQIVKLDKNMYALLLEVTPETIKYMRIPAAQVQEEVTELLDAILKAVN